MASVYLLLGILLLTALPAEAHVVLDGQTVQPVLVDIVRQLREARDGVTEEGRLEALYALGEQAQSLADLMNMDVTSHGQSLYADLLVQRLEEYGIRIRRVEGSTRYVYDMAAFKEYLKRSPRGKRAAEASYRLMAQAFYGSIGSDPGALVDIDIDQLRAAIRREEAFIKDFPKSDKLKAVRFFLAMDYYRLSRHSQIPRPPGSTGKWPRKPSARSSGSIRVLRKPGLRRSSSTDRIRLGRGQTRSRRSRRGDRPDRADARRRAAARPLPSHSTVTPAVLIDCEVAGVAGAGRGVVELALGSLRGVDQAFR